MVLTPKTNAEQNHLEHAPHIQPGVGRGCAAQRREPSFVLAFSSEEECFRSAKETLRDGSWRALGQRLESG